MPRVSTDTIGSGDQSWLGSDHGIENCRTEQLDISTFTAGTHYPNGYIPSGTPLSKVAGLMVPYTSAEGTTTGAGILYGHLFADANVTGTNDFPIAVLDHGRVRASKVPQGTDAFTVPVAAAKRTQTTIVYI